MATTMNLYKKDILKNIRITGIIVFSTLIAISMILNIILVADYGSRYPINSNSSSMTRPFYISIGSIIIISSIVLFSIGGHLPFALALFILFCLFSIIYTLTLYIGNDIVNLKSLNNSNAIILGSTITLYLGIFIGFIVYIDNYINDGTIKL